MIRALVTAALLAGAATQFFGVASDVAIGYGLVLSVTVWYFWPLLRRIGQSALAAAPAAPRPTARPPRRPQRRT